MRHDPKRLRFIVTAIISVAIIAIYLIVDPDDLTADSSDLFRLSVAVILAIGVAQPIIGGVNTILNIILKKDRGLSDLRDQIMANQHRLWIAGILRKSIENDPLIVPYSEIKGIRLEPSGNASQFTSDSDDGLHKKIEKLVSKRFEDKGTSRRKSTALAEEHKTIVDAYIASNEQLVILGEGGSGKTIALLQLLEHLHKGIQQVSKSHIPVVFNLGSWEEKQLPLQEWLTSEILDSFPDGAPEGSGRQIAHLVRRQQIIFLFDGLDEISRAGRKAFYTQLAEFSKRVGREELKFVICSRPEEYAETREYDSGQLTPKVILLRPIDDEAITQFLAGDHYEQIRRIIFGMDSEGVKKLLSARNAEQRRKKIRQEHKLYEPAHHPFILNALAVGYNNPSEKVIEALEAALTGKERMLEAEGLQPIPDSILERYVSQRFDNAEHGDYETYDEETTNKYLSWIAQKLYDTAEGESKDEGKTQGGLSVENLRPTWLDSNHWRLAYSLVSRALSTTAITAGVGFFLASPLDYLLAGMLAGAVVGLLDYATSLPSIGNLAGRMGTTWFRIWRLVAVYLSCSVILSIFLGLTTTSPIEDRIVIGPNLSLALSGITLAWFLSLFIAVIYITQDIRLRVGDIEPAEKIRLEYKIMVRQALLGGSSIGILVAIFAQALLAQPESSTALWLRDIIDSAGLGRMGALLIGFLAGAIFGGLFAGLFGLLSVSSVEIERTRPNQGIRKSIANALSVGLSLTVLFTVIFLIPLWFAYHDVDVVYRALRSGLTFGVLGGLWAGGISTIHHMVLRFFLYVSGRTPWNISRFLRYCSQIHIMREIGAAYIFGHDYVKLYYYKQPDPPAQPRWGSVLIALILFSTAFGLGWLRQSLTGSLYSFDKPGQTQYDIAGFTALENVCAQKGQQVTVQSRGVIRAGDYVGYVTPEGTDIGLWGIAIGDAYDYEPSYVNNVLMCRLEGEEAWRACAQPISNQRGDEVIFPMPWEIRSYSFIAPRDGCLQFEINDHEVAKRKGAYSVSISIDSVGQP